MATHHVSIAVQLLVLFVIKHSLFNCISCRTFTREDINAYRQKVKQMFSFAYDSYMRHAYPYDELRPISCDGMDTWGSFSLTLIDTLDTLVVMGNYSEFHRVSKLIADKLDFNMNINVSVFETNIRVVGGLLSAHLLSYKGGAENLDPGWPCDGPLLRLAENVARRLLPAFQTRTGMPYGTVNLRYGVPIGETPVTCTAGISTYIVEFGTLSRLIGDPVFEDTAMRALWALWNLRSPVGLVGNHLNVEEGKWTALDAGIGAGVDSYFEYLVKGAILFQKTELMEMFKEYNKLISKYMNRDDWFMWVSMGSGQVTMPVFQSLESYWPGLLSLVGEIEQARKSLYNYYRIWRQYGFIPEFYDIPHGQANAKREGYPLRPELIESVMYLYRATRDPHLLHIGADIFESIECSAKTGCGYATIKNVQDHKIEDRMESFFLAETLKYLYLLFDPDNFVHNSGNRGTVLKTSNGECIVDAGGYIFNTEAHPIDVAAVYCCSAQKKEEDNLITLFKDNLDLYAMLDIREGDYLKPFKDMTWTKMKRKSKLSSKQPASTQASDENLHQQTVVLTTHLDTSLEEVSKILDVRISSSRDSVTSSPSSSESVISGEEPLATTPAATDNAGLEGYCDDKKEACPQAFEESAFSTLAPESSESEDFVEEVETNAPQEDNVEPTLSNPLLDQMESDANNIASKWKNANGVSYWHMVSASNIEPKSNIPNLPPLAVNSSNLRTDLHVVNDSMVMLYESLVCEAQSFLARLSLMGEMFHV